MVRPTRSRFQGTKRPSPRHAYGAAAVYKTGTVGAETWQGLERRPNMPRKRLYKDNAARQQAYRDKKTDELRNVTASSRRPKPQPVNNTGAVNATAHGFAPKDSKQRFLQRPDGHDDVLYAQSLASADDELKLKLLKQLRTVAAKLMPVLYKKNPEWSADKLWERALERAYEILNGIKAPQEHQ